MLHEVITKALSNHCLTARVLMLLTSSKRVQRSRGSLHLRDHLFLLSEDFLGITGCHPPVFVQTDSFLFAGEKRNAERFFKLVHRSGQRRLCQMKHGSRLGQRPVLAEYNQVLQQV